MSMQSKQQTLDPYLNLEKAISFQSINDDFIVLTSFVNWLKGDELTTTELLAHPNTVKLALACHQLTNLMTSEKELIFSKILSLHTQIDYQDAQSGYQMLVTKAADKVGNQLLNELRIYYKSEISRLCGGYRSRSGKVKIDEEILGDFIRSITTLLVMKLENGDESLYVYNKKTGAYIHDNYVIGRIIRWASKMISDFKWTTTFEKEMIALLMRDSVVIHASDFNKTHINLMNDSLNLETLEVEKFSSNHLCTQSLGVFYDPEAICPKFDKFLSETLQGDSELIHLIQEIAGYVIDNETKANKAFFLYGPGGTGKSVMADVFQALVSKSLVSNVSLKNLETRFGMEPLLDKKLNIASENEADFILSNENFKAITSGDAVNIDLKGRTAINRRLNTKLIFVTNNLPTFSDSSYALIRRLVIVPFNRQFSIQEQNKHLTEELLVELPGIFNWALEGLKRLIANGYVFTESKNSEKLLQTYQDNINPVEKFCKECIIQSEDSRIMRKDLIEAYGKWLDDNAIADHGTKSPQKFWKIFYATIKKFQWSISETSVRGMKRIYGIKVQ